MKKLGMKTCIGLLVVLLLTLSACGQTDKKSGENNDKVNQTFDLIVQQEMPTADLSLATDTISYTALNNVYEGLYRLDKKDKPFPAGAKELAEVSEDGLTYKFKLRKEAKWSNGEPVTAADYVYGWQRTVDPKTGAQYAFFYELVENGKEIAAGNKKVEELGIKAINDHELEIHLAKATPYFDYLLALPAFFPQHKATVEKFGKDYAKASDKAVYNGPFTLTEFDGPGTDTKWSYTKNKDYWDAKTVKLEKIHVSVVREASTSLNLFQDQHADDVIVSGELAKQLANDPEFVVEKDSRTSYFELNQRAEDSVYRNVNLRKAISYSLDRKSLVEKVLGDGSVASTGLVPSGMSHSPKGDKDFEKESGKLVSFDKKKAKEYWGKAKKELGITSLKLDIVSDDTDSSKKVAEYIQGSLEENLDGLSVTISSVPFTVRIDRGNKGDFQGILGGWGADYSDPSSFLNNFVTDNAYNRGRFSNEKYDALMKKAEETDATNAQKRWDDMLEAEKHLIKDEMGVIPLYQKSEAHMRRSNVKGVVAHVAGARYDYKWAYIDNSDSK